jgi:hypothetical protein
LDAFPTLICIKAFDIGLLLKRIKRTAKFIISLGESWGKLGNVGGSSGKAVGKPKESERSLGKPGESKSETESKLGKIQGKQGKHRETWGNLK